MAVIFDAGEGVAGIGSINVSFTVADNPNRALISGSTSLTNPPTDWEYDGVEFTASVQNTVNDEILYLRSLKAPATGSNLLALTVGSGRTNIHAGSFYGVSQVDPIHNSNASDNVNQTEAGSLQGMGYGVAHGRGAGNAGHNSGAEGTELKNTISDNYSRCRSHRFDGKLTITAGWVLEDAPDGSGFVLCSISAVPGGGGQGYIIYSLAPALLGMLASGHIAASMVRKAFGWCLEPWHHGVAGLHRMVYGYHIPGALTLNPRRRGWDLTKPRGHQWMSDHWLVDKQLEELKFNMARG